MSDSRKSKHADHDLCFTVPLGVDAVPEGGWFCDEDFCENVGFHTVSKQMKVKQRILNENKCIMSHQHLSILVSRGFFSSKTSKSRDTETCQCQWELGIRNLVCPFSQSRTRKLQVTSPESRYTGMLRKPWKPTETNRLGAERSHAKPFRQKAV
jgi:hypothetical protein